MSDRPKVYLAGPAVFRPNAKEIGKELKRICAANGLEGLFPLDVDLGDDGASVRNHAFHIFNANCLQIRAAAAVVADISPFRGPHMDCGTAWEIGFALALGKFTFAYVDPARPGAWFSSPDKIKSLIERIWCEETPTGWRDAHGDTVEDFDLVENLMIGCSIDSLSISAERAIQACARHLGVRP